MALEYRSERLTDPSAGDGISAEQARIQNEMLRRSLQLPNSQSDSTGTRMVVKKTSAAASGLYWGMLMQDHPGEDTCFKIILGEWDPDENGWIFDCSTPEEQWETAVDFHYGAPEPDTYACGWFQRMESTTTDSGYIYVVVSLDCVTRGECKSTIYATGCGEA